MESKQNKFDLVRLTTMALLPVPTVAILMVIVIMIKGLELSTTPNQVNPVELFILLIIVGYIYAGVQSVLYAIIMEYLHKRSGINLKLIYSLIIGFIGSLITYLLLEDFANVLIVLLGPLVCMGITLLFHNIKEV